MHPYTLESSWDGRMGLRDVNFEAGVDFGVKFGVNFDVNWAVNFGVCEF